MEHKNKLYLNASKCKYVSYNKKCSPIKFAYSFNSVALEELTNIRDLGIIFDQELSFATHMNHLVSSSLKLWCFVCRTCSNFKNIAAIKTLYFSLIRSKLEYVSIVWNPFYRKYIKQIENVQRRYLKFVYYNINNEYRRRMLIRQISYYLLTINLYS